MKKLFALVLSIAMLLGAMSALAAEPFSVGFAQIGQESGWRDAETASIKETFEAAQEAGELTFYFSDAQQKQENQIAAIRNFINQGVDVIGLAPVVTTGWGAVFQEAKDAGIPIVLLDREVEPEFEDLYDCFIGSDFILEGQTVRMPWRNFLTTKEMLLSSKALSALQLQLTVKKDSWTR